MFRLLLLLVSCTAAALAFQSPQLPHRYQRQHNVAMRPLASSVAASTDNSETPGILKTITQAGNGMPLQLGDIATIRYSCYLANENDNDKMATATPFAKASSQKMVVGDGSMIEGWDRAVRGMRVGERCVFRLVDPTLGYGAAGVPPLVPPNAPLELDVEILDAQPPTANIDFDNLAILESTPTTAAEISRAFEVKQAAKLASGVVEKEGLEGFLERVKKFYFFGLFEGETGERAPWFLRPSITFPIAFAVVGATFYVTIKGGAISERGAAPTDELDEIILSSNAIMTLAVNALSTTVTDVGL